MGQKWRTLKNIAKFIKNPVGLMYWRYMYKLKQNRELNVYYTFFYVFIGSAAYFISQKCYGNKLLNKHIYN